MSLLIPGNVVEAHAKTRWDREAQGIGNGGLWDDAPFEAKESALVESEQDLQAALAAWGMKTQYKCERPYPGADTHQRLITAWTPVVSAQHPSPAPVRNITDAMGPES